jgi:hypothetical protein
MWKEAVVANYKHYTSICLEGLSKSSKNLCQIVGFPADIRTGHLQKTNQNFID